MREPLRAELPGAAAPGVSPHTLIAPMLLIPGQNRGHSSHTNQRCTGIAAACTYSTPGWFLTCLLVFPWLFLVLKENPSTELDLYCNARSINLLSFAVWELPPNSFCLFKLRRVTSTSFPGRIKTSYCSGSRNTGKGLHEILSGTEYFIVFYYSYFIKRSELQHGFFLNELFCRRSLQKWAEKCVNGNALFQFFYWQLGLFLLILVGVTCIFKGRINSCLWEWFVTEWLNNLFFLGDTLPLLTMLWGLLNDETEVCEC